MDKTMNMSIIYGIIALLSLLLAGGYCSLVRKKEIWLIWLHFSVFVANLGYFALSISKTTEEALLANRLAYLGCVCLPLFMLMTIIKVCGLKCPKLLLGSLIGISFVIFLITASQGYFNWYYREVSLVFVNGMAKLCKVYGPLHTLYYVYLFMYFAMMIGTVIVAMVKKTVVTYKHAGLLIIVVFLNIAIWLVEQFTNSDFEFLSVSYIVSELLLLFLYGMIQEYELISEGRATEAVVAAAVQQAGDITAEVYCIESVMACYPEAENLTVREKDVLKKILEDKKRKEIAEELFITENTVKKHTSSIFAKLGVTNRSELFDKMNMKAGS